MIRTSGGVLVGLTVQPVQVWKKERYKLFNSLILLSSSIFNVNIITPTSRGDILRQLFPISVCISHESKTQMPGGKDVSSGQT